MLRSLAFVITGGKRNVTWYDLHLTHPPESDRMLGTVSRAGGIDQSMPEDT